jgi:hypothetical protein
MIGVVLGTPTDSSISSGDNGRTAMRGGTAFSGGDAERGWSPIEQATLQSNLTDE